AGSRPAPTARMFASPNSTRSRLPIGCIFLVCQPGVQDCEESHRGRFSRLGLWLGRRLGEANPIHQPAGTSRFENLECLIWVMKGVEGEDEIILEHSAHCCDDCAFVSSVRQVFKKGTHEPSRFVVCGSRRPEIATAHLDFCKCCQVQGKMVEIP